MIKFTLVLINSINLKLKNKMHLFKKFILGKSSKPKPKKEVHHLRDEPLDYNFEGDDYLSDAELKIFINALHSFLNTR